VFQPNERFPGLCYDIRSCPLSCFIFLPNGTRNGGQFLLIRIILRNVFQTAGHKLLSNCENSSADYELDFSYKKRIKTQDRTERNSVGRKKHQNVSYMYSERENKIVLVSLSEGTMGKGKKISE
jgi:hypothetical protein